MAGEIKGGKVSGFHNWIQFYLLEKSKRLNYYSHSFNGPVGDVNKHKASVCVDMSDTLGSFSLCLSPSVDDLP